MCWYLLYLGGLDDSYNARNHILEYAPVTEEWVQIGNMRELQLLVTILSVTNKMILFKWGAVTNIWMCD